MKAKQNPEDDPALRRVLHEWKADAPLPPRFQEGVWRRIEQAERDAEALGLWAALSRWLEAVLPRPKFALSYVCAVLVLGLAAGSFAAQAATKRVNAELGARYVQSVDPYRSGGSGQ